MTLKSAYTKIRAYFSKPDAQFALSESGEGCMYRTAEGRKCAVGILIPDKLYNKSLEGTSFVGIWTDPKIREYLTRGLSGEECGQLRHFLNQAQLAHDMAAKDPEWRIKDFLARLDGEFTLAQSY